jgi:PAS domain S-box-containing protein
MSNQRNSKRSFAESNSVANSLKECNSTPYKRRKQTSQALEALSQLFKDSLIDDLDNNNNNKFNKNDILSLTLSRLLRNKYWPSNVFNRNVQLAAGIQSSSIADDLTGFIIVLNTAGRIILLSDNVEYFLRKNVRSLYPQLTSIYDCVSKEDHDTIRQMLSTPNINEKRAICNWILPRGKRPNRSHAETKSMLLTGHYFFLENEFNQEPLFVAHCEQILSSIPNIPTNSIGLTSATTLRFILTDQLNICEISPNAESILGYNPNEIIDQSVHRILPTECLTILEQAKQNCLSGEYCTSMNVLDLFTRNGDRLTFLCNTHILIEGRRKTMKLGFLAQLIDPSARYECLIYANKQNIDRQKASVRQERVFITNMVLNNSTTTNVLISPNDQCLSMYELPKIKRERVCYQYIEKENYDFYDQPQVPFNTNLNNNILTSPTQEMGHIDEFFNWLDGENNKSTNHAINDTYGINYVPDFGFLTPTISEINFF